MIEHLIITEQSYYSFADTGALDHLKKSKKHVLKYKEEERIRKEAKETGEKKGEGKKAREIAQQMKLEGYPVEKIAALTGLKVTEIKKIKSEETKENKKR